MYVANQYRRQITRFLTATTPAAFALALGLLALALASLGALFFFAGAPAMSGRPWDVPIILDGAWRIANGQVPHRDFFSHLGALPFYVTWLGMKIGRPSVSAITYGNVLLMAAVGLSAIAVLRRRTGAFYALAMSLFLSLLGVTPRPLGDPYNYTDYAMMYNRYGEAFIGLLGVILLVPLRPGLDKRWANWLELAFAGSLLTILLFCKLNYFMLGVGLWIAACCLGRFRIGESLLCLVSAGVAFIVIINLTHIPASLMKQDFQIMAAAQSMGGRLRVLAVHGIENALYLPVLFLLILENASRREKPELSVKCLWRPVLLYASIFGGALLLLSSNCQDGEMPLLALAGLYGAEMIRRDTATATGDSFMATVRNLGALALFAILLFPTFGTDCKTMLFVARNAVKSNWVSTSTLASTHLNDFRFVKDTLRLDEMRSYMDSLDEGIDLLRRHPDAQARLTSIMFADPFHIALGLAPAEGGILCIAPESIAMVSHPPLERLLGNATHILTNPGTLSTLKTIYGPEWEALHVDVVEPTAKFVLLKIPKRNSTETLKTARN